MLIEFVVLCGFCCSLMLRDIAYKCLISRVQLWKEVTTREKSRWLMLMMNLGRALFFHNLISDEEIDICAHIFHLLCKTVLRTDSRACIPFCCLISRILMLKGVHPSDNESPYLKQSPINIRTLNASIGHSRKGIKIESSAPPTSSHSASSTFDKKLNNIMVSIQDISTKMSRLATLLHHHHILCDTRLTSLQTQLDQI